MKKLILTIALTALVSVGTGYAYESRSEIRRVAHEEHGRDSLQAQVRHLNRMLGHVRGHLRRYRADWRVRREVEDISRDVAQVNHRFERGGGFNRWRLRREVDRLHDRLHAVENRLHFRSRDFYRWD
ncbi:MAG TPA: hypothetical protein VJ719_07665 [Chthoniobacterales bacterium]|nr:hypothetical protein [Chthoniobacterales bacterium]